MPGEKNAEGKMSVFRNASAWPKQLHFWVSQVQYVEQQQCDWTRQCLYDATGPGPLVPPSAKSQWITGPWVFYSVLHHVGQFCRVRFWIHLVVPLFLEQFAVALPPLLIDGIWVQYAEADYDESNGGGWNQHFQSYVHFLWLRAPSTDVACKV